ncbi:MAG TPA: carboxypeptidase regulatory-like domain-containing protein [Candidatus Acidoferrum sp.]|nr:carboxypeptidase regulatory-like domain-containing protein [Candidatus Acidoferrum sp.]
MRLLLLLIALIATAAAQSVPSATVVVTDENGNAVRSARVFLQRPGAAEVQCLTDLSGRCQFPSLPAGTYQLRAEKEGLYALSERNVQMAAGATVEVVMSHQQEVREVVNVKESPTAIDPAQVAAQETITGLDVIDIVYPTTHDYRNVLNFIPGVVNDQNGQPHVAGAQTYQTVTLLDGFNVTQPANGQLLVRVSTDAFRSIQVEPSREPAEDGKGSGGVLNLNTGIGDDHFRFFATDFLPSLQNKHGWRFDQFLPRFTFSGPVSKGRAWFFNAFDGEYDNLVFTGLPVGQDNDHILRLGDLLKLQTNVTRRDILTTSFLVNYLHDPYEFLSPLSPQLSNPKDVESAYVASVKDQHYFAGGQLLDTGFAFDQYNLQMTPYGVLPYFVNAVSGAGGNYYLGDETHARRWQALGNLYLPSHQWHGRHDFKIGIDLDRISYDAQFARQPVSFLSDSNQLTAGDECLTAPQNNKFPCTRYSTFGPAPLHWQYNAEVSVYAEDRWSVTDRLLIEPGVRLDWDEIVRHAEVAPRLAGTYVLDNAGNTKLSAGIGIIYDATPIYLVARPFAGTRQDTFYTVDPNCTAGAGCVTMTGPVTTTFAANTNTLAAPRFVNWSIGVERKLPAAIYLKAEFVEKRGTRGFVYDTPNPGSASNFAFNLQNTRDDRYTALQITMRHNFRENYTIMGAYTRSSARSNQALDFNVDSPVLSGQQPGPYPWDTPNRFLSWGYLPFFSLPILHKLELAYSMEARTGFPFTEVSEPQQIIGKPGAQRFPGYFSLNLQLEKKFHLLGYYLALRGGFDNITGRCNPFVVNSVIDPVSHPNPTFSACEGRAFTSRIRLLGRK